MSQNTIRKRMEKIMAKKQPSVGSPDSPHRFDNLSPERRREIAILGGKANGALRRERKAFKEMIGDMLNMPLKSGAVVDMPESFAAIRGKNVTAQMAIVAALIREARLGDVRAAEFLRDTVGEKPTAITQHLGALPVVISGEDELED